MKQQDIIDSLLAQAKNNASAAESMFKSGHYDWCLFIWHLVIEKSLKALILKQNQMPPYIHNLTKLAQLAEIKLSKTHIKQLETINGFNLEARYDDDKLRFYKLATKDYADKWSKNCREIYSWILTKF